MREHKFSFNMSMKNKVENGYFSFILQIMMPLFISRNNDLMKKKFVYHQTDRFGYIKDYDGVTLVH